MRKKHLTGINLLKTIAIVFIVLYHIDVKILSGGFIGVDLFFVISGYLLMHSLIKYRDKSIIEIIIRRINQLWLIIFLMIFVVMVYITLFNAPVLQRSYKEALSGLTFMSNWSLIFSNVSYFDNYLVNPFKHLWYISVLIQSFVIIVILFKGFIQLNIKKYNLFVILMVILGIVSFTMQQVLYDPANLSRVYYGTDTRIYTIIIGVLGYFIWPIEEIEKRKKKGLLKSNIISIVSLATFVFLAISVSEVDVWLYRCGFLLVAILSLIMIVTIGQSRNIFSKIFSNFKILLFPGILTYTIYLWHYPIIVLSRTSSELAQTNLYYSIIRIIVVLIISYITYSLIEKPIRKYGLKYNLEKKGWSVILTNVAIYPVILVFLIGLTGHSIPYTSTMFINKDNNIKEKKELIYNKKLDEERKKVENARTEESLREEDLTEKEKNVSSITKSKDKFKKIILIGDSTAVYVGEKLIEYKEDTIVDAKVSRQLYNSEEIFEKYKKYDSEDTALIIMLGTNGAFSMEDIEDLVRPYPKSTKFFVNTKHGQAWESRVNDTLSKYIKEHKDSKLIDWYNTVKDHPEYLSSDRIHPNDEGVEVLFKLITDKLSE